jgi:hypothetical protein
MADQPGWQGRVEAELRAVGRSLEVPPPGDPAAAVRQRLAGRAGSRPHGLAPRLRPGRLMWRGPGRLMWRAALVVVVAFLAVVIAIPQGRAAIAHVFRFAGVELRQEPGPVRHPSSNASLPGQRTMSLERARHSVSFPILVPAVLGPPGDVVVSDRGRVVSLIYPGTRYGLVRLDEFAGHLDQPVFEKFVHLGGVTEVQVNRTRSLWIKGPQELVYVTRDGTMAVASARLTTGNTLIWGTRQVALRLEGNLGKTTAVAIADSAR